MARKITTESVNAFMDGRYFKKQNMEIHSIGQMKLHGNYIAWIDGKDPDCLHVSDCGWCTRTTYERLHALLLRWTNGKIGASMRNGGVLIDMATFKETPLENGMMIRRA